MSPRANGTRGVSCGETVSVVSESRGTMKANPLVAVSVAFLAALGLLTGLELTTNAAEGPDSAVLTWVLAHRSHVLVPAARAVTYSGTSPALYPLIAIAGLAVRWRTGRWGPGVAALVVAITGVLSRLALSKLVRDPRPPRVDWLVSAGGFSFPSGHAATSSLVGGALAWLIGCAVGAKWARVAAIVCLGWALLVSLSRVYLGVHWISDILGSWLLAGAWLTALLALRPHLLKPQPPA
jgi:undecaprenyl-diphosphatase